MAIFSPEGDFKDMRESRTFIIRLPQSLPASKVSVNNKAISQSALKYEGKTLTQEINIRSFPTDQPLVVEITYDPEQMEQLYRLNGKTGLFRRSALMGKRLKKLSSRDDWAATIPNQVLQLIETPSRIGYNPEMVIEQLREFDALLPQLVSAIQNMPQITAEEAKNLVGILSYENTEARSAYTKEFR